MKKGDVVKFNSIVDKGDEHLRMILIENPDGGRVKVMALVDMNIRPIDIYPVKDLMLCES